MSMRERRTAEDEQPAYYAQFRHPDGRWYRLWMTYTAPKTARGHPYHVHASYDLEGSTQPDPDAEWFSTPYGISNWDFDSYDDAVAEFMTRFQKRIDHGYVVEETNLTRSNDV